MTRRSLASVLALVLLGPAARGGLAQQADRALEATGVQAGLAVHVGTTDGKLELALARSGRMLVQGVALSDTYCTAARRTITAGGLYGLASVLQSDSATTLPYAPNLVNLLIADLDALAGKAPGRDEILRVLAPNGSAYLKSGGWWTVTRKARPPGMDDWTHYDHGAGGNPVSADTLVAPVTALRWYAGPTVSRAGSEKEPGLRIAAGRIIYAVKDYGIKDRQSPRARNHLVCRDANNGVLLWKVPLAAESHTPYRHEFIADADRVYGMIGATGPMVAIDAATGKTVMTYDQGARVEPMERDEHRRAAREKRHMVARLYAGRLIQAYQSTIHVLDAKTGRKQWTFSQGQGKYIPLVVAAEGKVFAAVGAERTIRMRGTVAIKLDSIVALDIASGKVLWRNREFAGNYMLRLVCAGGHLPIAYFPGSDRKGRKGDTPMSGYGHRFSVANIRAADGHTVWNKPKVQSVGGHYAITLVRGAKAYVACEQYIGYDLATGTFDKGVGQRTFVNACAETRATPKYILYGMSFGDFAGRFSPRAIVRSTCDTGVFPANGLVYSSPPLCCCLDVLAGYTATAAEKPAKPVPASQRLVRGPAYTQIVNRQSPIVNHSDWPMYMANPKRGCWTPTDVSADLKLAWKVKVANWPAGRVAEDWRESERPAGLITAPTTAAGRVFVAAPNQHRLEARSAETGKLIWSFVASSRIDSPPTIHRGLCIFGCRDGWVYALAAADGRLAWKFLAAVAPKRIVDDGHIESPWPVSGSVMVHQGKLLCTAGRHSAVDGGIQLYQLDPLTGRPTWHSRIWSASLDDVPGKEIPRYSNHGKVGKYYPRASHLLVSDGRRIHHFIETLAETYAPGQLVDLHASNGRWDRVDPSKMTWLRSNMLGLISRRHESVGRFDYAGVRYGNVNADALVIADGALYCVGGRQSKTRDKFGQLTRVPLDEKGLIGEKSDWKARIRHSDGKREHGSFKVGAMIVTGRSLFLAGHAQRKPDSALHAYSARTGGKFAQWALPARPVRNGLAAAGGRLLVSCEDGTLLCFAKGN